MLLEKFVFSLLIDCFLSKLGFGFIFFSFKTPTFELILNKWQIKEYDHNIIKTIYITWITALGNLTYG